MENSVLHFEAPKYQSSYIKVIGVGGGGTNAVNHMYNNGIEGVDFIVCNTDDKSLDTSPIPTKIKLGKSGLGAGNIPAVARERALEIGEQIKEVLCHNTQMLFITAGMGGGTGTGAAPVIAKLAKEIEIDDDVNKILVVAIVTLPFSFEGRRRRLQAEEGIKELRQHVDAILIINNDKLRDFGKMGLRGAFEKADDILLTAAKGIAEIITQKSYINVDFRDVNTVMQNSGVALMGSGIAEGENRALEAIEMATTSVLLNDNSIKGAKNILLYFASGKDEIIDMDEMTEITDYICKEAGKDVDVIWGAGYEKSLGDKLSITLIATGFDSKEFDIPVTRKPGGNVFKDPVETFPPRNPNRFDLELEKELEIEKIPEVEKNPEISSEFDPKDEPVLVPKDRTPLSIGDNDSSYEKMVEKDSHLQDVQLFNENSQEEPEELQFWKIERISPSTEQENVTIEVPFTAQNTSHEEYLRQRAQRMKTINEKLKNPQGLEELEKIPAYQLFGMDLKEPEHSSKPEVSRMTLNEKEGLNENSNPFIFDQPD